MKLLIAGSRSLAHCKLDVLDAIEVGDNMLGLLVDTVIEGGAAGVDEIGAEWAESNNLSVVRYPAEWDKLGKRAGYVRNTAMVSDCDAAIVVWDGESRGTRHTIDLLIASGKPFVVVSMPEWRWE